MKISLNWLSDYVDIKDIKAEELIKRIGLSTAEIEGIEEKGKELTGVITARVTEVSNHPNSQKLHLVDLDIGNGKTASCVCGAPNVRKGIIVPFATLGANVNGFKIGEATLAGVKSLGMCCSENELGISENHEGIMELPDETPLGVDIKNILPIEDIIFEVDNKSLTNRPDLWSHEGFAREIAAIFKRKLKPCNILEITAAPNAPKVDIKIENKELCRRYSMVKFAGISQQTTPNFMRIRLFYTGMRSINLLTDLSNYVMLDIGQPTHAFDGDKISQISIENAHEGEKIKTLDGIERILHKNMLTIRSEDKPEALAGIMGGDATKINTSTKSVCLESANFAPTTIRLTAKKLNLISEASQRFEKCLDPELTVKAIKRYYYLLKQCDKGVQVASALSDAYPNPYPKITISVTKSFIDHYCGFVTKPGTIEKVLKSLTFGVTPKGEELLVSVPSYRATKDISLPQDLVEEFARIYGYDNIKPVAPTMAVNAPAEKKDLEYAVKYLLASNHNLHEVHTYIWNDTATNMRLGIQTKGYLRTLNSVVKENDEIRSELYPSLLKITAQNKNSRDIINIFEIGRVVDGLKTDKTANEVKKLAIVMCQRNADEEKLFFNMQNILYCIFSKIFNQKAVFKTASTPRVNMHPKNTFDIILNGQTIGFFGVGYPVIKNNIDPKSSLVLCELNFSLLESFVPTLTFIQDVSKYQASILDFTFKVPKNTLYGTLESAAFQFKSPLIAGYNLVGIYETETEKNITISFKIASTDKTLTANEISAFSETFIQHMTKEGFALLGA